MVANGHLWTRAQFTKPALDLVWHRDYSLKSGGFSLNTLAGRVRVCFAMSGMDRHPLPRVSRCMQAILREAAGWGILVRFIKRPAVTVRNGRIRTLCKKRQGPLRSIPRRCNWSSAPFCGSANGVALRSCVFVTPRTRCEEDSRKAGDTYRLLCAGLTNFNETLAKSVSYSTRVSGSEGRVGSAARPCREMADPMPLAARPMYRNSSPSPKIWPRYQSAAGDRTVTR